jgi:hypothetical protein
VGAESDVLAARAPLHRKFADDCVRIERTVNMRKRLVFVVITNRGFELRDIQYKDRMRPRIARVELIGHPKELLQAIGGMDESILLERFRDI